MKSTTKNILVTGGAGYIGSILVPLLLKKGYNVRILDIKEPPKGLYVTCKKSVDIITADIRNINESILDDVTAVIHLAALSDESSANKDPKTTIEINATAAIFLAKKAKEKGVKRFIFASSAALYDLGMGREGKPKSEESEIIPDGSYSTSKYEAEKALLELSNNNFSVVILRKGTVYGYSPRMRFDLVVNAMVRSALKSGVITVFCRGMQWRPLIGVTDVANAYYTAIVAPTQAVTKQVFNIAFDNFLIKDVAVKVQKTLENYGIRTEIVFEQDDRKDRSYIIDTSKVLKLLKFRAKNPVEQSVIQLVKSMKRT